jgi:hypothetical protein
MDGGIPVTDVAKIALEVPEIDGIEPNLTLPMNDRTI